MSKSNQICCKMNPRIILADPHKNLKNNSRKILTIRHGNNFVYLIIFHLKLSTDLELTSKDILLIAAILKVKIN